MSRGGLVALALGAASAARAEDGWEATIAQVAPAVLSLRVTSTREYAGGPAGTSQGTGFVVDRERGIVLTNRHLVEEGPVVARGVLLDDEEVELRPLYRDPVHDFGFYAFDPGTVKHLDLPELVLAPDHARVGLEIRVLGNDAGEKLSILDGTLARLDREAPDYGRGYNDFDTFYIQAASNTSGGSSGSPVIDLAGRVVALNAGARQQAASSYYLPLGPVVRALDAVRAGAVPARGTVEAVFRHRPFEEARRLGLSPEQEARARRAGASGALVVNQVLPAGPAAGKLEPGDVVLGVGDGPAFDFERLATVLDGSVGQVVAFEIERQGVVRHVEVPVEDAHALTPSALVESGRGVFQPVGLQIARSWGVPTSGVMVAGSGYAWSRGGVPAKAVIDSIDGRAVPDLDALWEILSSAPHGQTLLVRWHALGEPEREVLSVVQHDRRWFPTRRCARPVHAGFSATPVWTCVDAPEAPPGPAVPPAQEFRQLDGYDRRSSRVARALVGVEADVPVPTAGIKELHYQGVGVVVDAGLGLVVVDRDTVPVSLIDVALTFGGEVRLPAEVVAVHPLHGFAVLRYDPALLMPDRVGEIELRDVLPREGTRVRQIALDRGQTVVGLETRIDEWRNVTTALGTTPVFREHNLELVVLDDMVGSMGGVLVDRRGRAIALWASFVDPEDNERFFGGLPTRWIRPIVDDLRAGRAALVWDAGIEILPIALADARDRGLSGADASALRVASPSRRVHVPYVSRRTGGAPARDQVQDGDLVVAAQGRPLGRFADLAAWEQKPSVSLTVVREGERLEVEVPTVARSVSGVDRVLTWAGMVLHDPHPEVAHLTGEPATGAYLAWVWYGGPGAAYGLRPTRSVVAVNGAPIADLAALVDAVRGLDPAEPVRLTTVGLDGSRRLEALVLDPASWPSEWLERTPAGWIRRPVEAP